MKLVKIPRIIQILFPSLTWKHNTTKKEIWLTFDDGPNPDVTIWILDLLKKLNVQATFFCIGKRAKKYPDIISKIIHNNHVVGNHTYNHRKCYLSTRSYLNEIKRCQDAIPHSKLFRPPYGKIFPWQILGIRKKYKNLKIIMWDVMSYDFNNVNPKILKSNVLNNVENGSIIVFHDNDQSKNILQKSLKEILVSLINQGYQFKTTW